MVKITAATAKQVKADAFIIGVDKDRKAPGLKTFGLDKQPLAKKILANKNIGLGFKSVRALPSDEGWIILVGLGETDKLTQEKLGTLANMAARTAGGNGCKRAATTLALDSGMDAATAAKAVVEGTIVGGLNFDQWKSKGDKKDKNGAGNNGQLSALQVLVPDEGAAAVRKAVKEAAIVAEAVNDARLLANTPANICTPAWMASEARKRGRKHGFKVSVKTRAALRKEGYNALCGVAQGSSNPEQLITMDYHPEGAKKTLVVVGKGVCFDSGGISIKPGNLMWEMKYDKCGACNTIALMTTLADLGVKHRVIGVVAAVENMPGGNAQRPGDIVTAKDGTTIEVLNTDAEGRLILADAITYGRTFKPDWMVDMATLTGACDFAVGPTYVAVMSKDDDFARSIVDAAARSGDKAWQLPQGEEFDEANKGTYADIQNISLTNKAGTAIGGSFVAHFAKDTKFAHLDIASKAWTKNMDYFGAGPTGAGTRIVLQRILDE